MRRGSTIGSGAAKKAKRWGNDWVGESDQVEMPTPIFAVHHFFCRFRVFELCRLGGVRVGKKIWGKK